MQNYTNMSIASLEMQPEYTYSFNSSMHQNAEKPRTGAQT